MGGGLPKEWRVHGLAQSGQLRIGAVIHHRWGGWETPCFGGWGTYSGRKLCCLLALTHSSFWNDSLLWDENTVFAGWTFFTICIHWLHEWSPKKGILPTCISTPHIWPTHLPRTILCSFLLPCAWGVKCKGHLSFPAPQTFFSWRFSRFMKLLWGTHSPQALQLVWSRVISDMIGLWDSFALVFHDSSSESSELGLSQTWGLWTLKCPWFKQGHLRRAVLVMDPEYWMPGNATGARRSV